MKNNRRLTVKAVSVGLMGLITFVTGTYGFASRFMSFLHELVQDGGLAYSLVPVATYFFVAVGFFCMLVWAFLTGQLSNVENEKYELLERQLDLERLDARGGLHHG